MDERDYKAMNKDTQGNGVLTYVSGSLFDVWQSKLEYANRHNLVVFSFHFENKTYLSEWRKAKWCEPYQIAEL